jgi:hypothetical protein
VCQPDRVITHPVMCHQNLSRQTLIDMGASVRDGGLSSLHHEDLSELEKQTAQRLARSHCFSQFLGGYPLSFAGDLDVGGIRRLITSQHHGEPAHPLAANKADLYFHVVWLDSDNRRNANVHKIDHLDPMIGLLHVLENRHRNRLQVRPQQCQITS